MTQGSVLSHDNRTTTTWSMTTAVLLENTTIPIELRCNSVELTRDERDHRELIEQLSNEFEFDYAAVDELRNDIEDAKSRIYAAALDGDMRLVSSTSSYASGIEQQLASELDRLESVRAERLSAVYGELAELLVENYGLGKSGSFEYFVPALNSVLTYSAEKTRDMLPFLFGPELERQVVDIFVKQSVSKFGLSVADEDDLKMTEVVLELPLPIYGSKPEKLASVSNLIQGLTSVGTAGVIGYSDHFQSPVLVLGTLAGAFVIWFATPHVKTIRDETNRWVEDWAKDRLRYKDD